MNEKDLKQGFWGDTDEILERCAQELGDYHNSSMLESSEIHRGDE